MDKARLDITEEILERVVYGMENQKDRLLLDPSNGLLRPETDDDGTFIPLPSWGPTDGYRLMDGFAGSLPDTDFRDRLLEILHSGNSVFRHFKDALKERPELEGLWRRYKKREMRRTALSWLSRWSEALTLEMLGPEPEEYGELSSAEFTIRDAEPGDWEIIREWDKLAESEAFPELPDDELNSIMLRERGEAGITGGEVIVAEGPSAVIVGFSWIVIGGDFGRREGRLIQVYVLPDLRGLGIGRMLAGESMKRAEDKGAEFLSVRTGASGKFLDSYFGDVGFSPVMTWWRKSLK